MYCKEATAPLNYNNEIGFSSKLLIKKDESYVFADSPKESLIKRKSMKVVSDILSVTLVLLKIDN